MDELLDTTGPWHYPIIFVNAVAGFTYPWRIMAIEFMAPRDLDYWCARPNDSITVDDWRLANEGVDLRCSVRVFDTADAGSAGNASATVASRPCVSWEYDRSEYSRTLIEEWNAVCDQRYMISLSQSILMLGMTFSLIFSHVADWYGRRTAVIYALSISILSNFAIAASRSFYMFAGLRMINAATTIGFFTLALEAVSPSKRAFVALSGDFAWFIGMISFPAVAYLVRDWRVLQLIISSPDVVFLVCAIFMDESPRWLASSGRLDRTRALVAKIIRKNKLEKMDVDDVLNKVKIKLDQAKNSAKKATLLDALRNRIRARATLVCLFNYCTVVLIYYHMLYFAVSQGSSQYLNLIYSALGEAPMSVLSFFAVRFLRRRPIYNSTYPPILAAVVVLMVVPESSTILRVGLATSAKLLGQLTWSTTYMHINELYPTHARAMMIGFVHVVSRISAIITPQFETLATHTFKWVPIAITALCVLTSWLATLVLPETFGRHLPDTFEETDAMLRANRRPAALSSRPQRDMALSTVKQHLDAENNQKTDENTNC